MKTINIFMMFVLATLTSLYTYTGEEKKELELQLNLRNNNKLQIKKISTISYLTSIKNTKEEEIATANVAIFDNIRHEKIARLCEIQVNPIYRNNKIGSEMVANIVDFAQAKNCTSISLYSIDSTQKFYEKLGFTCTKNYSETTCEMEKKL